MLLGPLLFFFSLPSYAIRCFLSQMRSSLTDVDSDHIDQSFPCVDFLPNQTSSDKFIFGHFHSSRFYSRLHFVVSEITVYFLK